MKFPSYSKDLGLLILRIGIGIMFILHGLPKVLGGPATWESLAQSGLPFLPTGIISVLFGLAATVTEFGGGLLLIIGFWHRIVCISLAITMAVAFASQLDKVSSLTSFAREVGWPLELFIVFIALLFAGPGRYSLRQA